MAILVATAYHVGKTPLSQDPHLTPLTLTSSPFTVHDPPHDGFRPEPPHAVLGVGRGKVDGGDLPEDGQAQDMLNRAGKPFGRLLGRPQGIEFCVALCHGFRPSIGAKTAKCRAETNCTTYVV